MERKIDIIDCFDGKKMVVIHDIVFKKKQYVEWKDVKAYLKRYVGDVYTVLSSQEEIYIGSDFPNEFTGSAYTYSLKGANVKAKANAVQGIPEMVEIATGGNYKPNDEYSQYCSTGSIKKEKVSGRLEVLKKSFNDYFGNNNEPLPFN